MARLSTKIRQLIEGGLINHWIEREMDKVARMSKDGGNKQTQSIALQNIF